MRNAREYLLKHQLAPAQIRSAPPPDLRLAVVIPCRDERDLPLTLDDLRRCDDPGCAVEVIVVLNASEHDGERVRAQNRETRRQVESMAKDARMAVHALEFDRLPKKHAGVGLARKLGMDEAVTRFLRAGTQDGIIVSLDADCRVAPDYLKSIKAHFDADVQTPVCSIYFEHPLDTVPDARHRRAVAEYELYLRYYRHALASSGHPCAHYTVGSCMAVRAKSYVRQGGMNRRKGAEDFYFLNKLMLLGGFSELRRTTVWPSPRASGRAPFGTGRAVGDALASGGAPLRVYAPRAFDDVAALIARMDALRDGGAAILAALPEPMRAFLRLQGIHGRLEEIRAHTASAEAFRKRFFRWFEGFRALKYVRFATQTAYPRVPVDEAARGLLARLGRTCPGADTFALLDGFRRLDRAGARACEPPVGRLDSTRYVGHWQ